MAVKLSTIASTLGFSKPYSLEDVTFSENINKWSASKPIVSGSNQYNGLVVPKYSTASSIASVIKSNTIGTAELYWSLPVISYPLKLSYFDGYDHNAAIPWQYSHSATEVTQGGTITRTTPSSVTGWSLSSLGATYVTLLLVLYNDASKVYCLDASSTSITVPDTVPAGTYKTVFIASGSKWSDNSNSSSTHIILPTAVKTLVVKSPAPVAPTLNITGNVTYNDSAKTVTFNLTVKKNSTTYDLNNCRVRYTFGGTEYYSTQNTTFGSTSTSMTNTFTVTVNKSYFTPSQWKYVGTAEFVYTYNGNSYSESLSSL